MLKGFLLLVTAILFNGVANVLLKKGMMTPATGHGPKALIVHYLTSWPIIAGLILFAVNVIAYTQALARLPLSVAYPIMVSLSGLIVISASLILFKETINWVQWLGFALIVGGIILVAK